MLTGLAGMASAAKPGNYCRIGTFLGCCLVAIVVQTICSIILGTVVIKHFQFESTVTREYYKDKGVFGEESHEDYFKPEQYFKDRNKGGRVGLTVYGCMLVIIISDILLSFASVYICRDLTLGNGQAAGANNRRRSPSPHRIQTRTATVHVGELGLAGQNWAELVGMPGPIQPIHLIQNSEFQFFTPYKLPNYAELYPEGIPNLAVSPNEQALVSNVPDEPPPAYTPTANTSLPGSSVVSLGPNSSPAEEHSTVQESTTLDRTVTPLAERNRSPELLEVTNLPSEHPGMSELSSECPECPLHPGDLENPGSSIPVLSLHPGDSETPIPVAPSSLETSSSSNTTPGQITPLPKTLIMTDSSTREFQNCVESDSTGSLPNSVEVESQNETTNLEFASVATETR